MVGGCMPRGSGVWRDCLKEVRGVVFRGADEYVIVLWACLTHLTMLRRLRGHRRSPGLVDGCIRLVDRGPLSGGGDLPMEVVMIHAVSKIPTDVLIVCVQRSEDILHCDDGGDGDVR